MSTSSSLLILSLTLVFVYHCSGDIAVHDQESNAQTATQEESVECVGCKAMIDHIASKVTQLRSKKGSREADILDILDSACSQPLHFVKFEYSPPKVARACADVKEQFEDQIEKFFLRKSSELTQEAVNQFRRSICDTSCQTNTKTEL